MVQNLSNITTRLEIDQLEEVPKFLILDVSQIQERLRATSALERRDMTLNIRDPPSSRPSYRRG